MQKANFEKGRVYEFRTWDGGPIFGCTKDYFRFDLLAFNRTVDDREKLEEEVRTHGYIPAYPIHCVRGRNGKLLVKDGHGRLETAQKLGIEVWYCICQDTATIYGLERSKEPWKPKHYLDAYVRQGKQTYMLLKSYQERTGIPLSTCIALVSGALAGLGTRARFSEFKQGELVIQKEWWNHACRVEDVIVFMTKSLGIKWAASAMHVRAIFRCVILPGFDIDVLKKKLKTSRHLYQKQINCDKYLLQLNEVYNKHSSAQDKLAVHFMATEAAKARNPVKLKNQEQTVRME